MILHSYTQIPVRAKKIPVPGKDEDLRKCHGEQVGTCYPWLWVHASEGPAETKIGIEAEFATTEVVGRKGTDTEQETIAGDKAISQTQIGDCTETARRFRTGGRSVKVGTQSGSGTCLELGISLTEEVVNLDGDGKAEHLVVCVNLFPIYIVCCEDGRICVTESQTRSPAESIRCVFLETCVIVEPDALGGSEKFTVDGATAGLTLREAVVAENTGDEQCRKK